MEKVGLKLNIQKTKIMAPGPTTSWEIDGDTVERVSDFILGGPKITADGDCSHEIRRLLLLGRKVMSNLDTILKSRDITFQLVKAVKKAECWRIDAFEQWCWRRLLRIPWTARRSNQSILKEISQRTGASASATVLKEYWGLISFMIDWFDLLVVQVTLKSFQHHNLQASIIQHSTSCMDQFSCPCMTTERTITSTICAFVTKVMPLLFNTV